MPAVLTADLSRHTVTMSDDLVNLKLEKLAGDEDEENGTLTLKTHPPPTEIGPGQQQRHDHYIDPVPVVHLALCELREPQLTNDQTQTETQIGMVERTGLYKLRDPKLRTEENSPRKQLVRSVT